jgi:hypothetical protein
VSVPAAASMVSSPAQSMLMLRSSGKVSGSQTYLDSLTVASHEPPQRSPR